MFIKYIKEGKIKIVKDLNSVVFKNDNKTAIVYAQGIELRMNLDDIVEICK